MARTYHHGDKQKERHLGLEDWRWSSNYPRWWDQMFHTRPRRQEERLLCRLAERDVEDGIWPLSKKPHKYYW